MTVLRATSRTQSAIRDIPFEIAVHNGEEDLEEEVDGIYKHGDEV